MFLINLIYVRIRIHLQSLIVEIVTSITQRPLVMYNLAHCHTIFKIFSLLVNYVLLKYSSQKKDNHQFNLRSQEHRVHPWIKLISMNFMASIKIEHFS